MFNKRRREADLLLAIAAESVHIFSEGTKKLSGVQCLFNSQMGRRR